MNKFIIGDIVRFKGSKLRWRIDSLEINGQFRGMYVNGPNAGKIEANAHSEDIELCKSASRV